MKRERLRDYSPQFAVLRAALFPVADLRGLTRDPSALSATNQSDEKLRRSIADDWHSVRSKLKTWVVQPSVREALFLSSSSISEAADALAGDVPAAQREATLGRLYRYAGRMTGRTAPFGLSSGYAIVELGAETSLRMASENSVARETRLDGTVVHALWEQAESQLRAILRYRQNGTLYAASNRYSVLARRADRASGLAAYETVEIEGNPALDRVLAAATQPRMVAELVQLLQQEESVGVTEAQQFVDAIIGAQLLECVDGLAAVGRPLTDQIMRALEQEPLGSQIAELIRYAHREFAAWDSSARPVPKSSYLAVRKRLLDAVPGVDAGRVFHVDARLNLSAAQIERRVVTAIVDAALAAARIVPPFRDAALQRFRERFEARYGGRAVPLLSLFDPEHGIGYDDGVQAKHVPTINERWMRVLMRRRSSPNEVIINERDITYLASDNCVPIPDAFSVHATLLTAENADDAVAILHGMRGPSGVWALGRFCHGDERLRELVQHHVRAEEHLRPDVVFADIAYLPGPRAANIVVRPQTRSHSLRFHSGGADSTDLPLSDLSVTIEEGRIQLWSARLAKEVLPRQCCAHGSQNGPDLYRFLNALEMQGLQGMVEVDLGPFSPRIRFDRIILQPASWTISSGEARAAMELAPFARYRYVQRFREEYSIPRWVRTGTLNESVLLDLAHPLGCDETLRLAATNPATRIIEAVDVQDNSPLHGPAGAHTHELVIPVVRNDDSTGPALPKAPLVRATTEGRFMPGEEWLAVHIFTAAHAVERVLRKVIVPLVTWARSEGELRRWFFLRYGQPHFHLRVRFLADPRWNLTVLLPRLHDALTPLIAAGTVWWMTVESYDREVERYGGRDSMAIVEQIFEHDSDFVGAALDAIANDDTGQLRWQIALVGLHQLVRAFALPAEDRVALLDTCRSHCAPHGTDKAHTDKQSLRRFHDLRPQVEALLRGEFAGGVEHALWLQRYSKIASTAAPLVTMYDSRIRTSALEGLLHMHVNRVHATDHQSEEFRLYDLLYRIYRLDRGRRQAGQPGVLP